MAGGLLEALGMATGDPQKDEAMNAGILQAGLQMMASRGSFRQALGQGGMAGMQGYQATRDNQWQQAQRGQQQKMWDEQNRQMVQQQKLRDLAPQFQRTASQNGMMDGRGPTVENAQNMQTARPSYDWDGYIKAVEGMDPLKALELRALTTKDNTELLTEGQVRYDKRTGKPLYGNPKTELAPTDVREYEYAKKQGYGGTFREFQLEGKRAGASNVSVSTGQKGFDNTLKLRGDFRSEPIYKAHQEVESAYAQIKQSLAQASPAGDLAGATKMMKILDPNSVVRESELGMAMAATGAWDRLQNYATNIVKGTKLTPTQRADFQKLADVLYGESLKQYSTKRAEYDGIAKRNNLNTADVTGAPIQNRAPSNPLSDSDPLGLRGSGAGGGW